MAGKKWQTFRKNCRKYPNRHKGGLHYIVDGVDRISAKIEVFFEKWLEANDWIEYHDGEVMVEYILNGANREVLVTADEVCGIKSSSHQ